MIRIEEKYNFNSVDKKIIEANSIIERNIESIPKEQRGFLSQNILGQLRTFVEYIGLKIYLEYNDFGQTIVYNDKTISKAMTFIKGRGNLKYIERFHYFLQITKSHYVESDDGAERLMLKYYKYLVKLKITIKSKYRIDILSNINLFPVDLDKSFSVYYKEIAHVLDNINGDNPPKYKSGKYYIQKNKPFFIDEKIYYEVTLTVADDKSNKFDRMLAFTKEELLDNYSVRVAIKEEKINIFGKPTTINIIYAWNTSIRACEIINISKIVGISKPNYQANDYEYNKTMEYMTKNNCSLYEIAMLDDNDYNELSQLIHGSNKSRTIFDLLDKCREYIKGKSKGSNVLKYLLYTMNNRIIKKQYCNVKCELLSNLNLEYGCIPFDDMPLASSLKDHNPRLSDLLDIFSPLEKEYEMLARRIKNNTEIKNKLYTDTNELLEYEDLDKQIKSFNEKVYYKHKEIRSLIKENNNVFIQGYENDTIDIIKELLNLSTKGIKGYRDSFEYYLDNSGKEIDDPKKKEILLDMFENSCVSLIYGAAGTGKSTLIKHLADFFSSAKKICLTNTNPALENLKRNIKDSNTSFMTIYSFLSNYNTNTICNVLIIDECSTVSNTDMKKVLDKCEFDAILLVGDIYQIESISFGNWFTIAKRIIPEYVTHELNFTWRSNEQYLLDLWELVRSGDDRIDEAITKNNISSPLNDSLLQKNSESEIILCLNYDGLYGINNINNYMQNINPKKSITIELNRYKEDDPILFGDTNRFLPVIYNNLPGIIRKIEEDADKYWFSIEIPKGVNQLELNGIDLELVSTEKNHSIVKFYVEKYRNADEDESSSKALVPFSLAYAVSIHKSQGLEYDSVKVIITNEVEELITHNIFYTAITRAKKELKIYWTPECQNRIIERIKHVENNKDASIIKRKIEEQK